MQHTARFTGFLVIFQDFTSRVLFFFNAYDFFVSCSKGHRKTSEREAILGVIIFLIILGAWYHSPSSAVCEKYMDSYFCCLLQALWPAFDTNPAAALGQTRYSVKIGGLLAGERVLRVQTSLTPHLESFEKIKMGIPRRCASLSTALP